VRMDMIEVFQNFCKTLPHHITVNYVISKIGIKLPN